MKATRNLTLALLVCCSASLLAQGSSEVNKKIVDIGKNKNQVWKTLKDLSAMGPRLTTSKSLDKAADWTMKKFKSYGLTNVHLDKWGEWPVGFQRGTKSYAKMTAPWKIDFGVDFTSPSWTAGTDGPMKAMAVIAPSTEADWKDNMASYKGKWVVFANPIPRNMRNSAMMQQLRSSEVAGIISTSRNDLVITSGNYNISWNNLPTVPQVVVSQSVMKDINLALTLNRETELEINLDQKMWNGPIENANVVADIKGTEKPDEMVIVSGHLDTWDGPGSNGVSDNGTGCAVALEAARILMESGAKPKRTIRFILWTGEEQGLHGSRRYVEMHKEEMGNISAVLVDDGGSNYEGGMTCLESMKPMLEKAQEPMKGVFPDMPFEFRVVERMPRGGGSDHAPFNAVGVPGFFWHETGRQDYNFIHHTQHDTLEYAIPEYLVQSATNSAVMSYNLACADTLLPRQTN